MKQLISLIIFILTALVLLSSCKKDNDNNDSPAPLPSSHIIASEGLNIPQAIAVPANLPGGNVRVATYYAVGVQKYIAKPRADNPLAFEWSFLAPDAELFDTSNTIVGRHGAGPFWRLSAVDSIFAQQYTPVKSAPGADAQSIDWLLLKPKAGTTPTGVFANVEYIQRIATEGGKAPLTPPATSLETVNVRYTAIYRFTKMKP